MSCAALTGGDITYLIRTFASRNNDMVNIAYRAATEIMQGSFGGVDVILPTENRFMDEISLENFFYYIHNLEYQSRRHAHITL